MKCSHHRAIGVPVVAQPRLTTTGRTLPTGRVNLALSASRRISGPKQLRQQLSAPSTRRCSLCVRAAGGVFGGSGEVFVAGAAGQLGVRVVLQLLDAGVKVAAGVPDREEAQNLLGFAKTYELIKKDNQSKLRLAEVDFRVTQSLASEISSGGTVVAFADDAAAGKRADSKLAFKALAAAKEAGAGRFVLITPQGGAGSGGGLFGLFGLSGGAGSKGRSSLEQQVISSGLSFVIIRHAKTSRATSAGLQLGAEGSLPSGASYQPLQVAAVAAGALQQASGNLILEAWASSDAPYTPVNDLLASVLPSATVETGAPEAEAEVSEPEPAATARPEGAGPKPKRKGGFLGSSGPSSQAAAQNGSKPGAAKAAGSLFGTRSVRTSKQSAEAENESPSQTDNVLGGLLGGAKQGAQQVQPDGKSARRAAAAASKAQAAAAKQAGRKAGDRPGAEEESGGSWLSLFGISQKTTYADEE